MAEGQAPITQRGAVQAWEVDRNNHWNTRYYLRSFQSASEIFSLLVTGTHPTARDTRVRHIRFHRELLVGDVVTVNSARLAGGPLAGQVLHRMVCDDQLVATALDSADDTATAGPVWDETATPQGLPRGLPPGPHDPSDPPTSSLVTAISGIVRPDETDHSGDLLMHQAFGHMSGNSNLLLTSIGLTPQRTRETGLNRMAVEAKFTWHGPARAGTALGVKSWISFVTERSFAGRHLLTDLASGQPVATFETCMLPVDLNTRRSVPVPDFLIAACDMPVR